MHDLNPQRYTKAQLVEKLEAEMGDNAILRESYEAAAAAILSIQADDAGWGVINEMRQHDGFAIHHLKEIYSKAKQMTKGNPLLKRGFTLRCSYVWGRGIDIVGTIPPRFQAKIDKNWDVLFTQSAFIANERALYNSGHYFLAYDKGKDIAYPISFAEITNFASNPDRNSDVWYYQRTHYRIDPQTGQPEREPIIEWYPVAETQSKGPLLQTIIDQPVNRHIVLIDVRVNRDEEEVWGVPDVLPAMPYAWAHAEYLRDGSKLLKALSTIAWKVVSKSKGNSTAAAVKVAGARGAAATANMTADTDLVAMPKSGQVNLGDGDRIASYVAAALGVSLTALLSTASAAAGSFGAEASLDTPSQNDALSRQAVWADFYRRVLRVMGFKPDSGVEVRFRSVSEDPAFRNLQGLSLALQNGGLHQEEFRNAVLALMDVKPTSTDMPEPNGFTGAQTTNPDLPSKTQLQIAQMNQDNQIKLANINAKAATNRPNPNPAQGNTGKAGKMSDGDNTLRDAGTKPGTGSK